MMLHTPRLLLREFTLEDLAALNEIEGDPRVTRYLPYDPHTRAQTQGYLEETLVDQMKTPRRTVDLAIVQRGAALETPIGVTTLIGRCGLGIRRPEHQEAMIWYLLHPAYWGRGYALEAASALMEHAFAEFGLHRVWADCDPRNTASCRIAERLGMTLEGRLRENYFLKGEWCDTSVYGMLSTEWPINDRA